MYLYLLADVVTNIVADVITTCFSIMCWLMLLPSGRWNSHCRVVDVEWLMLLPLGRFYSPGSIILLQFKFWNVKQNLIPYMWQMVFANISIQGWIVDPDVKSFFYCPLEVLFLPSHNGEIFNTYAVASGIKMIKYGGGGLLVFLKPLTKGS